MSTGEMPSLSSSVRSASMYDLDLAGAGISPTTLSPRALLGRTRSLRPDNFATAQQLAEMYPASAVEHMPPQQEQIVMANIRRLVQVYIVDPHDSVPLADCMLYKGDEKITDSNDQELFFDIDLKSILEAHNAKRTKLVNKAIKDRTEHLEPVRIRDLKMNVVTIAQF